MTDTYDNTDVDALNQEANEVEDQQEDSTSADTNDDDDDLDFENLTEEEIAAINSIEGEDEDDANEDMDEVDDAEAENESNADVDDGADADESTTGSKSDDDKDRADIDVTNEAELVAIERTAIDEKYDAALQKLTDLGNKLDEGEIYDGAYQAEKAKIEREITRLQAADIKLSEKEDALAIQGETERQSHVVAFDTAVASFMNLPENQIFNDSKSAAFSALDKQLGFVAETMPPGTDFMTMLNAARKAVGAYIDLPESNTGKQASKPAEKEERYLPNISNMPSVVANTNEANKYAHIDKLSGPEQEKAIASMSDDARADYLNS